MGDDRPPWARRLRAERLARSWSQADVVRALAAHGNLAGHDSLVRQWKRWESGEVHPGPFHQRIIARTFGTATAVIFPPERDDPRPTADAELSTVEVLERIRASAVDQATIDALRHTVQRLSREYSHASPAPLRDEAQRWLSRLTGLLDRRLSLAQHREVLVLAGRLALLVGCVEYDLDRRADAEATRRAAHSLGKEAGSADVVGWAHEMSAWFALTQDRCRAAIAATDAGLDAVDLSHSVGVQLLAQRARAWARLGDRREVEISLDRGRALLDSLPYPEDVDDHFVVDPAKWDFYITDCYRDLGEDTLAAMYAHEVLRTSTDPTGALIKPMRAAEARITLGVVAARAGELEEALAEGERALSHGRRSLPGLLMRSRTLAAALRKRFPGERAVDEFTERLRALAS
ncbi:hypothetical protein Val02_76600 [Virgisporangium aliadipatigenens]|uniref:XRE family transcriptional regulator n=1 Tax=Virgisporangium aliadipatigenens TaxID=741659 RepID=A0A8J3YSA1_9ACTN|nr:XRE family transcriptional regulator [Virgisporangium aliadipatigenens]GIJ50774.1 hypothetical protein Val02_76600 [Virgisporangium aliadipatigenens]